MKLSKPTADLCDEFEAEVQVLRPGFQDFGGEPSFAGIVTTLRVHEDNALVRATLSDPGQDRVLVIDGSGSLSSALVGGNLAKLAEQNRWSGIVVAGAVRDVAELRTCRVGLRALASNPRKSRKAGVGTRDAPVEIGGVNISPGVWIAADADGIIVASRPLC
jgi:regulator of ribonuclease activity A